MTTYGFSVLVLAFVLAITFQEGAALKCWRCSSDSSEAAFCNDPFDQDIIPEKTKRFTYGECIFPPQYSQYGASDMVAVCKKLKQDINGKTVISRQCSLEPRNAEANACQQVNTASYIKTEFCETCTTDGCNSAGVAGPIAIIVALPAILAKILAW